MGSDICGVVMAAHGGVSLDNFGEELLSKVYGGEVILKCRGAGHVVADVSRYLATQSVDMATLDLSLDHTGNHSFDLRLEAIETGHSDKLTPFDHSDVTEREVRIMIFSRWTTDAPKKTRSRNAR